jgi:hypothetical protein
MAKINENNKNILLSVIIPLSLDETNWDILKEALSGIPVSYEIIFVCSKHFTDIDSLAKVTKHNVHIVFAPSGRASHMNHGAHSANGEFYWFLHADSKITDHCIEKLLTSMQSNPEDLLYFDLEFYDKHTCLLRLNEWGANVRSRILGIPFGDQGFCISNKIFHSLGGYSETVSFGEDHLLVWQARQSGIKLKNVGATLATSARKYKKKGWLNTTLKHQYLTIYQALSQIRNFFLGRSLHEG